MRPTDAWEKDADRTSSALRGASSFENLASFFVVTYHDTANPMRKPRTRNYAAPWCWTAITYEITTYHNHNRDNPSIPPFTYAVLLTL